MDNDFGLESRLQQMRGKIETACIRAGRRVESVRLIAVTKNHTAATVQKLIDLGVTDIGENRVQEIEQKQPQLTGNFTLHMIGHLQTNKAQKVWPLVGWIQSVDREKLVQRLESIYTGGPKKSVLVEVNTSGEESKSGCSPEDCKRLCELVAQSKALELNGLMTIGPLGGDERSVKGAFALLRDLSEKSCYWIKRPELSMGMSGDFEWAIEQGSTMVRIGTALVGER
ncbi:MAG: YggS family pyridoxal phosphate-dependent enzyme [Chitinispirillales bacterium]|jgi:pyridoxal phosphate enzyme (YggS family)|nr:YggS family pyridoxal phosphate-dependent enzyme [Chitinispirillales bacterium]